MTVRVGEKAQWFFERSASGTARTFAARLGEVWRVKNPVWSRLPALSHLRDREGFHPGLCIRPRARLMAFGTSKLGQTRRSKSRVFEVPAHSYPGGELDGAFLLDYAVPTSWEDCSLTRPPALLPEALRNELSQLLGAGTADE
ncbi:MAG TPA: hypothetical protein PLP29_04755 [Candidatus Ozemobacteraceae bacterium]|nr:hypothetical protein [Candidatus Ozemobacteraceae bacterium]